MGADFLFAWFAAPGKHVEDVKLDYDAAIEFINIKDWRKELEFLDELEMMTGAHVQADPNTIARKTLTETVNALRNITRRRDIGWIEYKGSEVIFLTGGMSWGDTPTDAYRLFELLISSGLDKVLARKNHNSEGGGKNGITLRVK